MATELPIRLIVLLGLIFLVGSGCSLPPKAAIASAHPLATRAGLEIIEQGGNAFDAAVTVSAVLAVVEPSGSGLGGGGFWLLHRARDGRQVMVDGREKAPLETRRDMFLNAEGRFEPTRSINGPLAAGIPGMPGAIVHLASEYGRMPLKISLDPAIRYARDGFPVDKHFRRLLKLRLGVMEQYPAAAEIFLPEGRIPALGDYLVQRNLARTLEKIAAEGGSGFYQGSVAHALVSGVRAAGGIWSLADLAQYRVIEREPVQSEYQGIRITSAAPPSSGGVVLTEALNILSGYDLTRYDETTRKHLVTEALRRSYRDRSRYLGDPDYVDMPLKQLTSPEYAVGLRFGINVHRAGFVAGDNSVGEVGEEQGTDTTHFSIIDREGNRVSATLSINYPFGSCFVPAGTGVLLNDEMDDFVGDPEFSNIYGLTGGDANSIAPGKRMLSSMTPTFLEDNDRVAILGTPGGSRIISMVLLAVLDFAAGNGADSWVSVPRFHHQYSPDVIQYEEGGLTDDEIAGLKAKGHRIKQIDRRYGNMQVILWDKRNNTVSAASDPRKGGVALVR